MACLQLRQGKGWFPPTPPRQLLRHKGDYSPPHQLLYNHGKGVGSPFPVNCGDFPASRRDTDDDDDDDDEDEDEDEDEEEEEEEEWLE